MGALFLAALAALTAAGCAERDYSGGGTVDVSDVVLAIHCTLDTEAAVPACEDATVVDVQATVVAALDGGCVQYPPVCFESADGLTPIGAGWLAQPVHTQPGEVRIGFVLADAISYHWIPDWAPWQHPQGGPWLRVCGYDDEIDPPAALVCSAWGAPPTCD